MTQKICNIIQQIENIHNGVEFLHSVQSGNELQPQIWKLQAEETELSEAWEVAEYEESVEVRARLKCGSKAFRNAIAYTSPRKHRQRDCIGFMVESMIEQLEYEQSKVQSMLDSQTLLINDHVTKETVRTTDSVTRAVESCTDCFGTK